MKISELQLTLCGETQLVGVPCALIRFSGCSLRCHWCDTDYALEHGQEMARDRLLAWAASSGQELVLLTGGEPLLQPDLPEFAADLVAAGHKVLVETSGAHDITPLGPPVLRSIDIKCPGSGEAHRNLWSNLERLRPGDAVKLVLASREDYEFAKGVLQRHPQLRPPIEVLLSAAQPTLSVGELAGWIVEDRLTGVRLNLQAHRIFWPALEPRPLPPEEDKK